MSTSGQQFAQPAPREPHSPIAGNRCSSAGHSSRPNTSSSDRASVASRSPQTPKSRRRPRPLDQHATDSPDSSPTLPSPMSLHQLGIGSPLSPLRRQFPSPLAHSPPSPTTHRSSQSPSLREEGHGHEDATHGNLDDDPLEEEEQSFPEPPDDATEDSKDVLIERLTDLASRLSHGARFDGQEINNLHSKVDDMERLLSRRPKAAASEAASRRGHSRISSYGSNKTDEDPFWGASSTPAWLMSHMSDMSQHSSGTPQIPSTEPPFPEPITTELVVATDPEVADVSSEVANSLVVEAEKLCAELSAVVTSLQARREESDHIHGLFVERAELAAQRIIQLEARLEEVEDQVQTNESELSHLRLQLRAIEARCLEYVPPDADQELLESIENWKRDWATLQRKMTERHASHEGHSFHGDMTVTSNGSHRR